MNTLAKVPRAVRLSPETVERVKALAKSLERSEQQVLESAVESFLDAAEQRGARVREAAVDESAVDRAMRVGVSKPAASQSVPSLMSMRQSRLNKEMGW